MKLLVIKLTCVGLFVLALQILMMSGVVSPVFRLPYVPMTREQREECVKLVEEFGIENTVFDKLEVMEDSDFEFLF